MQEYYSESWHEATQKFRNKAAKIGAVKWCVANNHNFDIPYILIGNGPHKVVINSGVHGIEGYFGSAAQLLFLDRFASRISPELLKNYTFVLIHVINGWGMQNRMREVMDKKNGGLVDLNRNFGVDFSVIDKLPQNPGYELAHDLLLSEPDAIIKKNKIKEFRQRHLDDGVWSAISNGQYKHPYGLFYGGCEQMTENKMALSIYDEVMKDAKSLLSIGLHTGLGRFYRKEARVTSYLMVSHPKMHDKTRFFNRLFYATRVMPDEAAVNGPTILGDLVDCLETRYETKSLPVYTADFEIGTGEFPIMSPVYKRMDMGDARYDLLKYGKISKQILNNLTESWYPSDARWRRAALDCAAVLFHDLLDGLVLQNKK
jgi:hypothetical protein